MLRIFRVANQSFRGECLGTGQSGGAAGAASQEIQRHSLPNLTENIDKTLNAISNGLEQSCRSHVPEGGTLHASYHRSIC